MTYKGNYSIVKDYRNQEPKERAMEMKFACGCVVRSGEWASSIVACPGHRGNPTIKQEMLKHAEKAKRIASICPSNLVTIMGMSREQMENTVAAIERNKR